MLGQNSLTLTQLVLVVVATLAVAQAGWKTPEQLHIAIGERPDQMVVVWTTFNATADTTVRYGTGGQMTLREAGGSRKVTDPGSERRVYFMHHVVLSNLTENTEYTYKAGSDSDGYSQAFTFTTWPQGDWAPDLLVYGDLGLNNPKAWPAIQRDVATGEYEAILHLGDIAYNMDSDNSRVGDAFMNMIQPVAATLPYMTCPGNHEAAGNFSNYRNRFYMPGDDDKKMYFSFNMGPIHFISMSTEAWYDNDIMKTVEYQNAWLEKDLKEATSAESRALRPWIVAFGHRPMYCSNSNHDDCTNQDSRVRSGIPYANISGVEQLFYKYGVDVLIWAHEHSYERLWPVFDKNVHNGSKFAPYTNPEAPVHIITGDAGSAEGHDPFPDEVTSPLSAFHSDDYGYLRMKVYNSSHLYMEQFSTDKNAVIDKVWVIKDKHGPYSRKSASYSHIFTE